ncbi:ABC transporter permease [Alteromonadaceae bacterium M269]|nr:ABC transporter permease [Alteromonadaceae bacterium M269]
MDKIWLVARWEFMRNFKWKQELISYLVMIGIYAAIGAVQVWNQKSTQSVVNLGVVGVLEQSLSQKFAVEPLTDIQGSEAAFQKIEELQLDGVLQIVQPDQVTLYATQQSGWQNELEQQLAETHREFLLKSMDISAEQLEKLQDPIELTFVNQAEEVVGSDVQSLGLIVAVLAAVAVFTSFGLAMTSVTQEKQHRITEQLLTCISHQQWVDGKALGLCLSSLKSLLTTAIMIGLVYTAIAAFSDSSGGGFDISVSVVFEVLLFCILGVFFWNYVFVGFSATIDDPNHSGKTGVMMLPMLPVMLVFMVIGEPNGQVAKVLSLLPLTSISFMPMRVASMDVPVWQVGLSFVLLVAGIYYVRLFASRVFRANITLFGKEPGWGDIWRNMLKSD